MTAYTDMSWEKLPDGFYYIKLDDGEIRTDCYEGGYGFIRHLKTI